MSLLESKIESVLLLSGEPVSVKKLEKILKAKKKEIEEALKNLAAHYAERGIRVLRHDGEWQFGTAPEHAPLMESLVKEEFTEELSKAAAETLAVIAYKGPMTRAEIEFTRGVQSSYSIRNLMLRGLIERVENLKDGRSYLYRVSFDFLKHLGLSSIEELPNWKEFRKSFDSALPPSEPPNEPGS